MRLMERLKKAFNPSSHDATLSHYIPAVQYADSGVENAIWVSDLAKRVQDWKGDTGRVYSKQVLTVQGPLLFPLKVVPTSGLGGTSVPFGQYVTTAVAGFGGRPALLDATSLAAEYEDVNYMSNPAIGWIKEHPAITASVAGGVGLLVFVLSRSGSSGSSSDVAAVANSQIQQATLANQNNQVQTAAQVQQNQDALAAQVQNNQVAAALAATVAQVNAGTATAQIAADVQNNTTNQQATVAEQTINAELTAQQSQVEAESKGLTDTLQYYTQVNQNQASQVNSILQSTGSAINFQLGQGNNASQSSAQAFLEALVGATGPSEVTAAGATQQEVGNEKSSAAETASIVSSITGGLSGLFSGLFT